MALDFWNFNYQISNIPKVTPKKKDEELVTKMFPWFTDKQVKQLYKDTALVPAEKRQEAQQEIYRYILPQLKAEEEKTKRTIVKNDLYNDTLNEKSPQKRAVQESAIKVADFADAVRSKYWQLADSDDEIVKKVVEKTPNGRMLFQKYLNEWDEEIFYQAGIKEREAPIEWKNPLLRAWEWLLWAWVGAVEWAIEWITDGFTNMIKDSKRILANDKKSAPEKFNQILFWEFWADYIGGTIGKTFGWALEWLYKWFTTESERKVVDKKVKSVMESIVQTEPVQNIMKKYNQLETDQQQELNDMLWYAMNATEFAWIWLGAKPLKQWVKAGMNVAKEWLEIAWEAWGKVIKWVSEFSPIEWAANLITSTAKWQDKLFKAQSPSINILNKNRNLKTIRKQSDIANELIVKEWFNPVDTETRRIAHEKTMSNVRKKVEDAIWDRKTFQVDQRQFAKELEDFIAEQKKLWVTETQTDIKALEEQAKALRKQRFIDLPTLEKKKQVINWIVNNRWDSKVWDVYKNWMKKLTASIGKIEDELLSKIPWEFSDLKKEFWALRSTYEDVLKADIKNQKAKWMNIIETYSKFEGIWDIIWWTLSLLTKWWAWVADVGKWVWKVFLWKALKKATDPDFLIQEWFKDLSSKVIKNATTDIVPNTIVPKVPWKWKSVK